MCAASVSGTATWADAGATAGKASGVALAACTGTVADVQWTQTAGPSVPLLAAQAQALAFEPPAAGTYGFTVAFTDPSGTVRSLPVALTVGAAAGGPSVTARLDHAVRGGSAVSVRAWPSGLGAGETVTTYNWTQLEGPGVTLDTAEPDRILFTAPSVSQDTLLRFRVTMRTSAGATDTDDAAVLVVRGPTPATGAAAVWDGAALSPVHPYSRTGRYASVLAGCVYDPQAVYNGATATNLCSVGRLPLLGTETGGAVPTVAQVMSRVVVSHDWMGDAFQDFLTRQDPNDDVKRMLNGVTAVVIGSHVRPSFYYVLTGAIYIDADYLWRTPAERDTINEAPDYRSGFDKDLGYTGLWRYVRGSQAVPVYYLPSARVTRSADEVRDDLAPLLYHELTHAADFMPPAVRDAALLVSTATVYDNALPRLRAAQLPSDRLAADFPLQSPELKGLACVKFWGRAASVDEVGYQPADVGRLFAADRATDEYNYSVALSGGNCPADGTSREDIAMLVEEFLQTTRQGARRDVAFTNKYTAGMSASQLFVAWGQRGRIGDPAVRPRVRAVLPLVAPWIDPAQVDALPVPTQMAPGRDWSASLVQPQAPGVQPQARPPLAEAAAATVDADRMLLRQMTRAARRGGAEAATPTGRRGGVPSLALRLGVAHR